MRGKGKVLNGRGCVVILFRTIVSLSSELEDLICLSWLFVSCVSVVSQVRREVRCLVYDNGEPALR